jgi:hypothetical protein
MNILINLFTITGAAVWSMTVLFVISVALKRRHAHNKQFDVKIDIKLFADDLRATQKALAELAEDSAKNTKRITALEDFARKK